eukprot:11799164-Karenia_brevis.AAC.1
MMNSPQMAQGPGPGQYRRAQGPGPGRSPERRRRTMMRSPFYAYAATPQGLQGRRDAQHSPLGSAGREADAPTAPGIRNDLHAYTISEHQMKHALLLAVIVGECAAIIKLLARKDKIFDKGLHASTQGKFQMKDALILDYHMNNAVLLDVVVQDNAAIHKLLARKDATMIHIQ